MSIIKVKEWEEYESKNQDPYGKCCVDVAREVMKLLDEDLTPLHKGYNPDIHTPHGLICKADDNINAGGITGFMAGAVASMISNVHSRGEEFRKIWNSKYILEKDDKGGVVNPAVVTIMEKESEIK